MIESEFYQYVSSPFITPPCQEVALVCLSFRCLPPLTTDCIKVKRRGVLFSRLEKVPDCRLRDCLTSNRAQVPQNTNP